MAARIVDAISHMPDMDGQDSDATGAYTQTDLGSKSQDLYRNLIQKSRLISEFGAKV